MRDIDEIRKRIAEKQAVFNAQLTRIMKESGNKACTFTTGSYGFTELEQAVYDADRNKTYRRLDNGLCPNCGVFMRTVKKSWLYGTRDRKCHICGFTCSG